MKTWTQDDEGCVDQRWTEVKCLNPFEPRSNFAIASCGSTLYLYGGKNADSGTLADLQSCDLSDSPPSWRLVPIHAPCQPGPLCNHVMAYYDGMLLLHGGLHSVLTANPHFFRFDILTSVWSQCRCLDETGAPFELTLESHNAAVVGASLYLGFGFDCSRSAFSSALYRVDLRGILSGVLKVAAIAASPRTKWPPARAAASWGAIDHCLYLFGGQDGGGVLHDFWSFDAERADWTQLPGDALAPGGRKGSVLVGFAEAKCLLLFGGLRKLTQEHNDVHIFALNMKRWVKIHSDTNEVYEASPTLKKKEPRSPERKAHKPLQILLSSSAGMGEASKLLDRSMGFLRGLHEGVADTPTQKRPSVLQEKKHREFLQRKRRLLEAIGQEGASERKLSPTSSALLFSMSCVGEQPRSSPASPGPKVVFDAERGLVVGKKPCARDGASGVALGTAMVILGGDRHNMAFNDMFKFDLVAALDSLPRYVAQ